MDRLCKRELCTGCSACASVCSGRCIDMEQDSEGFLRPVVNEETCIGCGRCQQVCPVLTSTALPAEDTVAYAAYSKDEAIRLGSSSGGVFTEFAKAVLKDGGAVFGAAYNAQFEVVHICAENEADLAKLRGAKYAQSDLGDSFRDVKRRLLQGQKVLFSGTPCQVGGLKAFLRKDYENLLTVDFVCHSVPSPMVWREYVKYRARQDNGGAMPEAINLRDKQTGWTNYQYSNLFTYANGHTHAARSGESLYMKLFVGDYINRESCANCRFKGYSRVSDLTIGDFWGIWDIAPEMDDNKGTSVVLVQTQRGAELLQSVADRLILKPVMLEETSRQNGAMLKAAQSNPRRAEAFSLIRAGQIGECESWFAVPKITTMQRLESVAKRILRKLKK